MSRANASPSPTSKYQVKVVLQEDPVHEDVCIEEGTIPNIVVVYNEDGRIIPASTLKLVVFAGDRFSTAQPVPELKPFGNASVNCTVKSNCSTTLDNFPNRIDVQVKTLSGELVASRWWSTSGFYRVYARGWKKFQPQRAGINRFNILIFGPAGSGKTLFLQRIAEMLQVEVHMVSGGDAGHCTREVIYTPLGDLPIAFWDLWGVDKHNFVQNELLCAVHGLLPPKWKMHHQLTDAVLSEGIQADVRAGHHFAREIHGLIFYIPVSLLDDPDCASQRQVMKEHFAGVKDWCPIVILGRADEAKRTEFPKLKLEAAGLFNIPKDRVYLNSNEDGTTTDRDLFRILQAVMTQAKKKESSTANEGGDLAAMPLFGKLPDNPSPSRKGYSANTTWVKSLLPSPSAGESAGSSNNRRSLAYVLKQTSAGSSSNNRPPPNVPKPIPKFCSFCGKNLTPSANFCASCGEKIAQ